MAFLCVGAVCAASAVSETPKPTATATVLELPDTITYDAGGDNFVTITDSHEIMQYTTKMTAAISRDFVMVSTKPQPSHPTYSPAKINLSDWPVNSVVWSSDDGKEVVGFYPGWEYLRNGTVIDSPTADHGLIISDGVKIPIEYKFAVKTVNGNLWYYFALTEKNGQIDTFHSDNAAEDVEKTWYCSCWPGVALRDTNQVPMMKVLGDGKPL